MKGSFSHTAKKFLIKYSIACSLIVVIIVFCLIDTTLVSVRNIRNVVSDVAPILLMSAGMAICLFSGFVDLSAGAIAALSGIIAGSLVQRLDTAGRIFSFLPPLPAFLVIPIVIALFYAFGMFYGFLLQKTKIPSWFFTLAASSVLMGLGYLYVSISEIANMQVTGFTNQFLNFGVGYIGTGPTYSVPFSILTSIIVLTLLWLYLQHNKLDFNHKNAELDKRNTKRNLRKLFACSTALFSLAGILICARDGVATPTIGFGLTSDALVICLIAGFSLQGSKGSFMLTFVAAIIYIAIIYCLTFIGVNPYFSLVIRGIILVSAVLLEKHINNTQKEETE